MQRRLNTTDQFIGIRGDTPLTWHAAREERGPFVVALHNNRPSANADTSLLTTERERNVSDD
jgi:hypothetical protein